MTPIDDYIKKQERFDERIKETEKYLKWLKTRTGWARYKARNKVKEVNKTLEMLIWMKDNDTLPWEIGPTFSDVDLPAMH
jgi:hypothetical protein